MIDFKPNVEAALIIEIKGVNNEQAVFQISNHGIILSAYPEGYAEYIGSTLDFNNLKVNSKPRIFSKSGDLIDRDLEVIHINDSQLAFFCYLKNKDQKSIDTKEIPIPSIFRKNGKVNTEIDSTNSIPKIPKLRSRSN